ncbi:MAG TPA: hypothetical protein VFD43_10540, partial [Planctomycetota bacterium]|nr:hypothetical protein [Planctomycetota bacterium]
TRSDDWNGATIRLLARADRGRPDEAAERLRGTLEDIRIEAEVMTDSDLTRDKLILLSRDASLVFLPLRLQRRRAVDQFGKPVDDLVDLLPMLALVCAVQDIALGAGPEEGEVSRVARLLDAVKDAQRALVKAEAAAGRARKELDEAQVAGPPPAAAAPGEPELSDEERLLRLERRRAAAERTRAARRNLRRAEGEARSLRARLAEAQAALSREQGESSASADAPDGPQAAPGATAERS